MAERSFTEEVKKLRAGNGEVFRGEGILAITKALLQAGVSYVGGYQGAPVSHLMDVLTSDSKGLMSELGVHTEVCANEAAACAMLAASVNYPLRGAVTWKSTVGTNLIVIIHRKSKFLHLKRFHLYNLRTTFNLCRRTTP